MKVSQAYMKADAVQAIIANSGNANACTGVQGISDARETAKIVAKGLGIRQRQVAICSTGVIGLPMPMTRILPKLPELVEKLRSQLLKKREQIKKEGTYWMIRE